MLSEARSPALRAEVHEALSTTASDLAAVAGRPAAPETDNTATMNELMTVRQRLAKVGCYVGREKGRGRRRGVRLLCLQEQAESYLCER